MGLVLFTAHKTCPRPSTGMPTHTINPQWQHTIALQNLEEVWKKIPGIWKLAMLLRNQYQGLTHWGQVTHICVSKLTIIDSDNGLSPGQHQAIIWTNAGILLIRTSGISFSEISSEIHTFSFKKMHSEMSAKWRPFCLGLNELTHLPTETMLVLPTRDPW